MVIKPPKKLFLVFTTTLALVGFVALGDYVVLANPAQLYEYYNTGDTSMEGPCAQFWRAQTFTPQEDHTITSVKLKISRKNSPGILTVGIRSTDGDGHPTGSDLCSGTIDANTITSDSSSDWYEIGLSGSSCGLPAGTKYAILSRLGRGDLSEELYRFWVRNNYLN